MTPEYNFTNRFTTMTMFFRLAVRNLPEIKELNRNDMTNREQLGLVHIHTSFYLEFSERVIVIVNFFDVQRSPIQPLSRR